MWENVKTKKKILKKLNNSMINQILKFKNKMMKKTKVMIRFILLSSDWKIRKSKCRKIQRVIK
jgi:hypothetical protein